jgi:hypothetical protein
VTDDNPIDCELKATNTVVVDDTDVRGEAVVATWKLNKNIWVSENLHTEPPHDMRWLK